MTAQQQRFSELVGAGLTATAAYREAYPARGGARSLQTEITAASRLRRHPAIARAIEREREREAGWREEWGKAYTDRADALRLLERIGRGEVAAKYTKGALADLARANRAIRAIRASRRKEQPDSLRAIERTAWRMFLRMAHAIQRTRTQGGTGLSAEARTELIFARYRPISVGESVLGAAAVGEVAQAPGRALSAIEAQAESSREAEHISEIAGYVRAHQAALGKERVVEVAERKQEAELESDYEWGPLPGHFPPRMGWRREPRVRLREEP
jgi:hypothetical protein